MNFLQRFLYLLFILFFSTPLSATGQSVGAISGTTSICITGSSTLSDTSAGGLWSSTNAAVATVGSSGIVHGVSSGTSIISYVTHSGFASTVVTIYQLKPITGSNSLCQDGTSTLSDSVIDGTWSSSSTGIASVDPITGIAAGVNGGTAYITYTAPQGCYTTLVFTVNPIASITGHAGICQGSDTTLSDATPGGVWVSANPAIATMGSTTGVLTGVGAGSATISYYIAATGCKSTVTAVIHSVSPITGSSVCVGKSVTLTDATTGGTWVSTNTAAAATVGSTSGMVSGVSTGSSTISYTSPSGCIVTYVLPVYAPPAAISGNDVFCQSATSQFTNSTPGGTWSSGNLAVTSIGTSGLASGVSPGTTLISYTSTGGCYTVTEVTVNPVPAITGSASVCVGNATTLSDAVTGGTWYSSNTSIAPITTSGRISGISAGTTLVSYSMPTGCMAISPFTVNNITPITGNTNLCEGSSATLYNSTSGGVWTSSNSSVAGVSVSGSLTGVNSGSALITYTLSGGCYTITQVTVNATAAITGSTTICLGSATTLNDAINGGTWTSSNTTVATIGSLSGVLTSLFAGTSTIRYTAPSGCTVSVNSVINPLAPIIGPTAVCQGSTTSLSNAVAGGTWGSTNPAVAIINPFFGLVDGLTSGTTNISYTNPSGCIALTEITVNPSTPISGSSIICEGTTALMSNATTGGTWGSSNTAVASIVASSGSLSAVSNGTAVISYTTPAGCLTSATITVRPIGSITGPASVCNTATYTDVITGGTWTSGTPTVATIGLSTGIVSGITPGTATILYSAAGCSTSTVITVNAYGSISGLSSVCTGNSVTLTNPIPGGTWSSLNTAIASPDSVSGNVTGISAGSTTIKYSNPAGCISSFTVTVNPHAVISGSSNVCQGSTTPLSGSVTGGSWSSSNPSIASVNASTGLVTGNLGGTATLTYTTLNGCNSEIPETVNAISGITGPANVCQGNSVTFSDATPGGTWASSNPLVASIGSASGSAIGIAAGTTGIRYTSAAGCIASASLNVNPVSLIYGATAVCQGLNTTLADTTTGGTWISGSTIIATAGITSGVISGLTPGTTSVTYTTPSGCKAMTVITVNPTATITGTYSVCQESSTLLSNAVSGGTWSSANPLVSTVNPVSGSVTGVSAGVVNITYTTPAGCTEVTPLTVFALPGAITGNTPVCPGHSSTLSNSLTGGTWNSGNALVASVGSVSGVVTGISSNSAIITYTTTGNCFVVTTVTVNPLPSPISGSTSFCESNRYSLTDSTTGGSWTSSNSLVASIGASSGIVSAVAAGPAVISYTAPDNCMVTVMVTVHPVPAPITGITSVCQGSATTLFETLAGGTWSSSNDAIATIGSSTGTMSGLSPGNVIISYITPFGCYTTIPAIVDPTPVILSVLYSNPSSCISTDGTITLTGLNPGTAYTIHYTIGTSPYTSTITADFSGNVVINGLGSGSYGHFIVTSPTGCTSNVIAGPFVLMLPPTPPAPVTGNNSPFCAGTTLQLTASDSMADVTYSWNGPGGFVSGLQNPTITSTALLTTGTYSVTATRLGCVSPVATTSVIVRPIPDITGLSSTNPTTCQGVDGTVTLDGLLEGFSYLVSYQFNGHPYTDSLVAGSTGDVTIAGLISGTYSNFVASSFSCVSNTAGPVTLADPVAAPTPVLQSNSPVCSGSTLLLDAPESMTDLVYDWTGPNGFSSDQQNPQLPNITQDDSGTYYLTIRHLNCPCSASINVTVYPAVVLSNVTESHTVGIGTTVLLQASGAQYYTWSPNDGSIANISADSTKATPQQTTTYTVQGMNAWGCTDTAQVTITVDDYINEFVPNAFTPNNDGRNDVFKIGNVKYDKLVDFSVYNRWGELIYHNTSDPNEGWDGTFRGIAQETGSYNYSIVLSTPEGKLKYFKGEVVLIR